MPNIIGTPDPHASAPPGLNGFGLTSLVLGFIGLLLFFLPPLALVLSIGGVILGACGWVWPQARARRGLGLAIGGTILSAVALGLNIILLTGGLTFLNMNRY